MLSYQSGILQEVPAFSLYLNFDCVPEADWAASLQVLAEIVDGKHLVVGFGLPLVLALDASIEGLKTFPNWVGAGIDVPSNNPALWCWLRGNDAGDLMHRARYLVQLLSPYFQLIQQIDAFKHGDGLDLTGYEDGTENPQGPDAVEAAIVQQGEGLQGSSFVAVQQWLHDFDRFESYTLEEQNNLIGRDKTDNHELEDAPETAHVKRTEQEAHEPAAFLVRRSMPWTSGVMGGLMFVAFGKSFTAFEKHWQSMLGHVDGKTDALFKFTRPVTGHYFWCPAMQGETGLDLSALLPKQ